MNSVKELLESDDPLRPECFEFLLRHREEDSSVDYKETFHSQDKDWLELTKDVMAFANTCGGYLVFGVRDASFDVVGLDSSIAASLVNTDQIQQKINRYIEPHIVGVRTKGTVIKGRLIVVLFVPRSLRCTHVFSKDGKVRYPSGDEQVIFRKGTLYVRRSGGNHLVDSRDLDEIFDRRLDLYRNSLMGSIARVVDAPQGSEVIVVSAEASGGSDKRLVYSNSPDAIPVAGLSFSIPPKTNEEAVAGWIAMTAANNNAIPDCVTLWQWYNTRANLNVSEEQRLAIAKFCLIAGVPTLFWLKGLNADDIKEAILKVISLQPTATKVGYIAAVGCFLGRPFYKVLISRLKGYGGWIDEKTKTYPRKGPRSLIGPTLVESQRRFFKGTEKEFRLFLEQELIGLCSKILETTEGVIDILEQAKAQAYDCYLYAQDDQYSKSRPDATSTVMEEAVAARQAI
ncbi:MAG: ATP-binding protein [Blastocatellia bacterium]